jgi:small subunit ribosomal protein S9
MAEATVMETTETETAAPAKQDQKQEVVKKRAAPKRKASKKSDTPLEFVKSKRKRAIARASARSGAGKIRLNSFDINTFEPLELRRLMLEPLYVSNATYEQAKHMDININVHGGGQSSQAQAVRGAIAKSIVAASGSEAIKKEFMVYDRFMLIDDARRVEPKKFKGPKARARFQKSYR